MITFLRFEPSLYRVDDVGGVGCEEQLGTARQSLVGNVESPVMCCFGEFLDPGHVVAVNGCWVYNNHELDGE